MKMDIIIFQEIAKKIMKEISPKIGSQVEVVLASEKETSHYLAIVAEETEKGIILSSFEGIEDLKFPEPDIPIKLRFNLKDVGYEFDSLILAKKESPYKFLYVAKPVKVLRRQLRAYLRIDCEIPVTVIRRDDPRKHPIAGVITNISGGGLLVSLIVTIPADVQVELKFEFEDGTSISNVIARALSIRAGEGGSRIHAMQFDSISEEQRTAIIKYTFKLQQRAAKKAKKEENPS